VVVALLALELAVSVLNYLPAAVTADGLAEARHLLSVAETRKNKKVEVVGIFISFRA
jgi:hypothetical protein